MTDNSSNEDDKVGYRRPPRHSRFKPGESGNPAGRRKGSRNLRTDVRRALRKPVTFVENGKRKKASTQEALILKLRERALRGDVRALDLLMVLAGRYNDEPPPPAADQVLSADDEAIVAAFLAQNTTGSGGEASSTGRDTEAESKVEEPVPEQDSDDNKPPD